MSWSPVLNREMYFARCLLCAWCVCVCGGACACACGYQKPGKAQELIDVSESYHFVVGGLLGRVLEVTITPGQNVALSKANHQRDQVLGPTGRRQPRLVS